MRVICILCDKPFSPDEPIIRRLQKQPHRLILCPTCNERISTRTKERVYVPNFPQRPVQRRSQRSAFRRINKTPRIPPRRSRSTQGLK